MQLIINLNEDSYLGKFGELTELTELMEKNASLKFWFSIHWHVPTDFSSFVTVTYS